LGEQGVAGVAVALLGRHPLGDDDREARLLPGGDAALHRGDVLEPVLSEQRVGGDRRAVADVAVEEHALVAAAGELGDALAELIRVRLDPGIAGGRVLVAFDPDLLAVDRIAGVDQQRSAGGNLPAGLLGRHLLDASLDVLEGLGRGHQVVSSSPSRCVSASSSPTVISPSIGYPSSLQSFDPPMIEATLVKPCSLRSASAVRAERLPSPQTRMTRWSGLAPACSMASTYLWSWASRALSPDGTLTAPSRWPAS